MMNTFSEGLVLTEKSGLDPRTLLDVLVREQPSTSVSGYVGFELAVDLYYVLAGPGWYC